MFFVIQKLLHNYFQARPKRSRFNTLKVESMTHDFHLIATFRPSKCRTTVPVWYGMHWQTCQNSLIADPALRPSYATLCGEVVSQRMFDHQNRAKSLYKMMDPHKAYHISASVNKWVIDLGKQTELCLQLRKAVICSVLIYHGVSAGCGEAKVAMGQYGMHIYT